MGIAEVVAEQKKVTYTPYVRCHLTRAGQTTYTLTTADTNQRIVQVVQRQEPYDEIVTVVFRNHDEYFNEKDLRGYQLDLGFGFVISGAGDYIAQPPVKVVEQEFDSRPGVLTCTLKCKGMVAQLADDHASDDWTAGTEAIKDLVEDILDATHPRFTHCIARTSSWTGLTLATDVNLFVPGDNFVVHLNSTRLALVRLLLDHTYVYMRPKSDGTIEMIKPTTSGEVYDYEYELDGAHSFFAKLDKQAEVIPNYVLVYGGQYDDDTQTFDYNGAEADIPSVSRYGEVRYYEAFAGITSDGQCVTVAAAMLSNFQLNQKTCVAIVPMNCTAKLFDYVKITDGRQGDSITGNVGYIVRKFESGQFKMEIGFGGWISDREVAQFLSAYRRPAVETDQAFEWITISCPWVEGVGAMSVWFHRVDLEPGESLYLKAYGMVTSDAYMIIRAGGVNVWSQHITASIWKNYWAAVLVYKNEEEFDVAVEFSIVPTEGYGAIGFITYGIK